MTVHTPMSREEIADLLMLYDVGALRALEEARGRSANTNYIVTTEQGRFLLRINEGKSFRDMVYEQSLLAHLADRDLEVELPAVIPNVIKGHFTPIDEGKYASLFTYLDGRPLASWEVSPEHCAQIGAFLARLHVRARDLKGRRRHPDRPARIFAMIDLLRASPPALADFVQLVRRERRVLGPDLARRVPHGVLHGALAPGKTRFSHGTLRGVIDFETGSRGPLLYDLGVALNAWCWTEERRYDPARCVALLESYQAARALRGAERRRLYPWTRFAALRFAVTRALRFELAAAGAREAYRDYRHFARRMEALGALGRRGFDELCGHALPCGR